MQISLDQFLQYLKIFLFHLRNSLVWVKMPPETAF